MARSSSPPPSCTSGASWPPCARAPSRRRPGTPTRFRRPAEPPFAEIGRVPRRDRSSSASRSVHFRVEIGSRRPPDAVAAWKVIIPRTFNALRRPDRTAKPRNHADSHRACSCRSS
ncbi:MAG: hypothetical protein DI576_05940 [Actinomyces sp.]|nr:MAG: hypothetical protein DI576_05940 [Actinomyces sp.]